MTTSQPQSLNDLRRLAEDTGIHPLSAAMESMFSSATGVLWRQFVPIDDCGEPLIEIPSPFISRVEPHPYRSAGAPYGDHSPHFARKSVVERVGKAQELLGRLKPGCQIQLFDAYRPLAVQTYMVDFEFGRLAQTLGFDPALVDERTTADIFSQIYSIWAKPSDNPLSPPPHSTGAALDLLLIDQNGEPLDMGSKIDEPGNAALPNFFRDAPDSQMRRWHENRMLLDEVMSHVGFRRLPFEWWHFSYGDQMWAILEWLDDPAKEPRAIYGRVAI